MSFGRTQQLQELQQIMQEMSKEIMWVNDREEEELVFDWGDKNIDQYIPRKQESYSVSGTFGGAVGPAPTDVRDVEDLVFFPVGAETDERIGGQRERPEQAEGQSRRAAEKQPPSVRQDRGLGGT